MQNIEHARAAVEVGADIIVAQGAEAGGHGLVRSTFTLVPEVADYLAKAAPATVLLLPDAWPFAVGAIACNHVLLGFAGLMPRSSLLGVRLLPQAHRY